MAKFIPANLRIRQGEFRVNQPNISRLVNIKGVYEKALELLENPTPLEGAIALVLLDNSLEAIFKLVLDEVDVSTKKEPTFPMLLESALQVEELKELRSYKVPIMGLHGARNGFQHQGIIPDLSIILNEYKPLAENILKVISKQKLGIEWSQVSLSLLIKNNEIRDIIKKSEEAFSRGDYVSSTAYLIYAFETTKTVARLFIFGSGLSSKRSNISKYKKDDPLIEYITTLDEEIETFKLGLNYKDFRYYLDVAGDVGIKSVLDELPTMTCEEDIIKDFTQKLSNILSDDLMRTWYICVNDFVLKFIIRTEANPRITITLFRQLMEEIAKGFSKISEQAKKTNDFLGSN